MVFKEILICAKKCFEDFKHFGYDRAHHEMRKYIASKIDLCEDRDKHLSILEWDEYKPFAPMKREEYENRLKEAKERYEKEISNIEFLWNELGKNSPDYHKI